MTPATLRALIVEEFQKEHGRRPTSSEYVVYLERAMCGVLPFFRRNAVTAQISNDEKKDNPSGL